MDCNATRTLKSSMTLGALAAVGLLLDWFTPFHDALVAGDILLPSKCTPAHLADYLPGRFLSWLYCSISLPPLRSFLRCVKS